MFLSLFLAMIVPKLCCLHSRSFLSLLTGVHRSSGMQVAIKAVESGRDLEGENFHREVRMNKILPAHANIVRFIDSTTVIMTSHDLMISACAFPATNSKTWLDRHTAE